MTDTSPGARAASVREACGLFHLAHRGVISVSGGDARRWLDGMLSNDVAGLQPDGDARHCHAVLLTPIGRVVADLHVVAHADGFLLELERSAIGDVAARLAKYVIADDVELSDRSEAWLRLGVEGAEVETLLAPLRPVLAETGTLEVGYGFGGGPARQLFVPRAGEEAVLDALRAAGPSHGLVEGDLETLEVLRVEAGVPRVGHELDEEVLPLEARLDDAVSTSKGCYTGQEVIARIRSRGRVKHLLVGLRLEGAALPARGDPLRFDGARVGEVTSAVRSERAGAIALGFVRRPHDAPGTPLTAGEGAAVVAELPFVR